MARKHLATYPLYGAFPISLKINTGNRVGTGYIYSADDIAPLRERLEARGHPLRIRWRNEECRLAAIGNARRQLPSKD